MFWHLGWLVLVFSTLFLNDIPLKMYQLAAICRAEQYGLRKKSQIFHKNLIYDLKSMFPPT